MSANIDQHFRLGIMFLGCGCLWPGNAYVEDKKGDLLGACRWSTPEKSLSKLASPSEPNSPLFHTSKSTQTTTYLRKGIVSIWPVENCVLIRIHSRAIVPTETD
jgi:hypothetical protein